MDYFLPDIGAIILNAAALNLESSDGGVGLQTLYNSNTADDNNTQLYILLCLLSGYFTLNSQENITSDYVFVRARNSEFNYSENPSFISGSTGEVLYNQFYKSPQSFITTVGCIMIIMNY
jgi:hypothetical protein